MELGSELRFDPNKGQGQILYYQHETKLPFDVFALAPIELSQALLERLGALFQSDIQLMPLPKLTA